jgi:hypothetical protein
MTWKEIIREVTIQLKSEERNLASNRRFKAVDSIEKLIPQVYQNNPRFLIQIGKDSLKKELQLKKKLNSAEQEAINHIYSVLSGEPIPIKKRKKIQ